ncbi:MAG TPA: MlaD family protein [Solirubrobacteraceae bacterium]|jgi:virulence factor Mce-like protein
MQKRAPTLANILVIALFALSCFGLLLFLWESFGGPVPLKPKGYRFTVSFPQALQLAEEADVRVSGVDIGHVVSLESAKSGRTNAIIEMDHQYAPVRSNMHAILRQKTLLGETYVQLNPQGNNGAFIPDNGHLPNGNVEPSVTLDDILSLFNTKTRNDFKVWMHSAAASFEGRGEDLNADFASLGPFVSNTNKLVSIFAAREGALRAVVKNTGLVFNALSGRDHELRGLIVNGEQTFHAAAAASQAFADTWRVLPAFENKSRVAFKELDAFATDANPLLDQSRAWERQLAPLSQTLKTFSPPFERLLVGLGALAHASKKGLPAASRVLTLLEPVLGNLSPVLHNLDPFLQYLGQYQSELQSFFANLTSATEAHAINTNAPSAPALHFLRTMQIFGPEGLSVYSKRIGTNRGNAYQQTGAFNALASGLQVFSSANCANSAPAINGPGTEAVPASIIEQLIEDHVANAPETPAGLNPANANNKAKEGNPNEVAAPICSQQGPLTFNGTSSQYPHVTYSAK